MSPTALGFARAAWPDPQRDLLATVDAEIRTLVAAIRAARVEEPDALDVVARDVTDQVAGDGPVVEWTGSVDPATCAAPRMVTDPATVRLLASARAGTRFRRGDRVFAIAARVHVADV